MKIETIEGYQSLNECRNSIKQLADRIAIDISSSFVNAARIESIRSLLDLFESYNFKIEKNHSK